MNKEIIVDIQFEIQASIDRVWEAITDPAMVKQYFFGTNLITSWEVGSPIIFRGEFQGQSYEDKGIVLQFEPKKSLQYNYWSSFSGKEDKPENYQIITYSLETNGENTILTIRQSDMDSEEQKNHSEQNWRMVIEEMKKLLSA